jgi:hypothetical protein
LRVDTNFSEAVTEKIMNKIRKQRNFTIVESKVIKQDGEDSNNQGVSRFVEVPSNGQDE